jgi:hypothetical protein
MTDHTMKRLSAANQFPVATTVDADGLFDRIVLETPDRRLDRAPRRHRRPVLVLAAAVVVCGLLASAAWGISSLLGGAVIEGPTVKAEYLAAQKQLTLPPGYTWPALNWPKNSVTSLGAGGSFAVTNDQDDWECYWVDAIHSGDIAAQQRAQAALDDLMKNHIVIAPDGASENYSPPNAEDNPTLVFANDGGYQFKQRAYAEAADGEPKQLEQSCRANGPAPGSHR